VNDPAGVLIVAGFLADADVPAVAGISTVADVPRGWLHVRG
jgi:hypothetical protein